MSIYLVAYYFTKPKTPRVKTNREGWMTQPNAVAYDEQVALSKKITNKDLSTAKVILDMGQKKIVKNGWMNNVSFDDLFLYYYGNYPQYTKEVMEKLDPTYLLRFQPTQQPERVIDTSGSLSSV